MARLIFHSDINDDIIQHAKDICGVMEDIIYSYVRDGNEHRVYVGDDTTRGIKFLVCLAEKCGVTEGRLTVMRKGKPSFFRKVIGMDAVAMEIVKGNNSVDIVYMDNDSVTRIEINGEVNAMLSLFQNVYFNLL